MLIEKLMKRLKAGLSGSNSEFSIDMAMITQMRTDPATRLFNMENDLPETFLQL